MNTYEIVALLPAIYLLLVSPILVVADIRERRIPNNFLLPTYPLWFVSAFAYSVASGDWFGGLALPLIIGLVALIAGIVATRQGFIGMGDVKLLVAMAMSLSWKWLWVWLALPLVIVLAVVVLVVLANISRSFFIWSAQKNFSFPLAPCLFVGYAGLTAFLFI